MTAAWMRKQLDALMGTDRDQVGAAAKKSYVDEDVCKMYICGLCPNEIFTNTKMTRGECPYLHAPFLRMEYENRKPDAISFDDEFEVELQDLVDDCDQKVKYQLRKLAEKEQDVLEVPTEMDEESKAINLLFAQAEKYGEEGDITKSQECYKKAEMLKTQKQMKAQQEKMMEDFGAVEERPKLRACDVCSSLLGTSDTDRRVVDHFAGRLHVGYAKIREKLNEVKEIRKKKGLPPPDAREVRRRIRERQDTFEKNRDSRRDQEKRQTDRENRERESRSFDSRGPRNNDRGYERRDRDRRDRDRHDRDHERGSHRNDLDQERVPHKNFSRKY